MKERWIDGGKYLKAYNVQQNILIDRTTKIISIIGFIFITLPLIIIAKTPPASGYEISIYNAYPWYLWFSIIAAIFIGQIIIIKYAFSNEENKIWIIGITVVLTANALLMFMPLIRGYVIYGRGDVMSHIGWMKDILENGHIGNSNMYPMDHILGSLAFMFTGIDIIKITHVIPPIFSLFYVVSFYVLSKLLFPGRAGVLVTLAFSSILFFGSSHIWFAPFTQSFFVTPFFIYIYLKSRQSVHNSRFTALLILLTVSLVFFHSVTILLLVGILLVIAFSHHLAHSRTHSRTLVKMPSNIILIVIILIVLSTFSFFTLFLWNAYVHVLVRNLKIIYHWLMGEAFASQFQTYMRLIEYAELSTIELMEIIFNKYGQFIVFGILSLVCISNILFRRKDLRLNFAFLFPAGEFMIFSFFSLILLFIPYILDFSRVYVFAFIFVPLIISFSVQYTSNTKIKIKYARFQKIAKPMILCLFILFSVYFSTFNFYYSPRVRLENQQVSAGEFSGMSTFFDLRNAHTTISELGISHTRFFDALYGRDSPKYNIKYNCRPPDHFAYNKPVYTYLLLSKLGEEFYPHIYPEYREKWRFNEDDFKKMEIDTSVQHIYTNKDLNIYIIDNR